MAKSNWADGQALTAPDMNALGQEMSAATADILALKGRPGGLAMGENLVGTHLDTVKASGVYRQSSPTDAIVANGYPATANGGGILIVHQRDGASNIVHQEYKVTSGVNDVRVSFARVCINTVWSPWRVLATQRVDQSAGRAIYTYDDVNGREQLIYGDTGVRDLSGLVTNGWAIPAGGGGLFIRRMGSMVTLWGMVDGTNFTNDHFLSLASTPGFNPETTGGSYATVISSDYLDVRDLAYDGTFYVRAATKKPWRLRATWSTVQPWPTSLPGTGSFIANT